MQSGTLKQDGSSWRLRMATPSKRLPRRTLSRLGSFALGKGGDSSVVASVEKAAKRTAEKTKAHKRKLQIKLNKSSGRGQRPEVLCDPRVVAAGWLMKKNKNNHHGMHKFSRRYFILRRTDTTPRNLDPIPTEHVEQLVLSCYESDVQPNVKWSFGVERVDSWSQHEGGVVFTGPKRTLCAFADTYGESMKWQHAFATTSVDKRNQTDDTSKALLQELSADENTNTINRGCDKGTGALSNKTAFSPTPPSHNSATHESESVTTVSTAEKDGSLAAVDEGAEEEAEGMAGVVSLMVSQVTDKSAMSVYSRALPLTLLHHGADMLASGVVSDPALGGHAPEADCGGRNNMSASFASKTHSRMGSFQHTGTIGGAKAQHQRSTSDTSVATGARAEAGGAEGRKLATVAVVAIWPRVERVEEQGGGTSTDATGASEHADNGSPRSCTKLMTWFDSEEYAPWRHMREGASHSSLLQLPLLPRLNPNTKSGQRLLRKCAAGGALAWCESRVPQSRVYGWVDNMSVSVEGVEGRTPRAGVSGMVVASGVAEMPAGSFSSASAGKGKLVPVAVLSHWPSRGAVQKWLKTVGLNTNRPGTRVVVIDAISSAHEQPHCGGTGTSTGMGIGTGTGTGSGDLGLGLAANAGDGSCGTLTGGVGGACAWWNNEQRNLLVRMAPELRAAIPVVWTPAQRNAPNCALCAGSFQGMALRRRHRCHCCTKVVCGNCSKHRSYSHLKHDGNPGRVCDNCHYAKLGGGQGTHNYAPTRLASLASTSSDGRFGGLGGGASGHVDAAGRGLGDLSSTSSRGSEVDAVTAGSRVGANKRLHPLNLPM